MMDHLFRRIEDAHAYLRHVLVSTPLALSPLLSEVAQTKVYLKCEHLQPTGSFKVRGALNKIRQLPLDVRQAGVITVSSGNHGQAMAWAGWRSRVPVTVYTSSAAASVKLDAIRAWGATVVALDMPLLSVELEARRIADQRGMAFVSPYNDIDVIAGQGTMGLEIHQACQDQGVHLDAVYASVGGGGMISGLGAALAHTSRQQTRLVGCWPEHSAALYQAIEAGCVVDAPELDTISDGTAGGLEPDTITLDLARALVRDTCLVSEGDITSAMRLIAQTDRWMIEGAAGVAVAGMLHDTARHHPDAVAVVLCGRNINLSTYIEAVQ